MIVIVDEIRKVSDLIRESCIAADVEIMVQDTTVTLDGDSSPYYLFGHRQEIASRTSRKDRDAVTKLQKYPLIGLRLDTSEKMVGDVAQFTLNVAIVHRTRPGFTSDQRYEQVFKPVLYPLYELFFIKLREVGFMWEGSLERPEHTKIDRLFWGTAGNEKNERNIFPDPVDAIEIIDLRINKIVDNQKSVYRTGLITK